MQKTKIEWADHTLNPWEGCVRVSPACDDCYAAARDERFHQGAHWGKDSPRLFHGDEYWRQPLRWNRNAAQAGVAARVFCGSLCDVMEDRRDLDALRLRLYRLIEQTLWLDWLLLTKRPQNYRRFLPAEWLEEPRKNVWLLTSVERQDYLWRVKELAQVPGAIHGLSIEPLLGPLSLGRWIWDLDWIIIGGESGNYKSAPFDVGWARELIAEARLANTAIFMKQAGARPRNGLVQLHMPDRKGGDPEEWPEDLRIRELPKRL